MFGVHVGLFKAVENVQLPVNVSYSVCSACQKIVECKSGSRPTTPNNFVPRPFTSYMQSPTNGYVIRCLAPVMYTQGL